MHIYKGPLTSFWTFSTAGVIFLSGQASSTDLISYFIHDIQLHKILVDEVYVSTSFVIFSTLYNEFYNVCANTFGIILKHFYHINI